MQQVFPAPTLVLGLGRLGLAALERLGDDWAGLQMSGADASLKNLRLLWLRPATADEEAWREGERRPAAVAAEIGEGDLPSLALDFAVLRSLGLIRYRDGTYQVAVPRDAGTIDFDAAERLKGEASGAAGPQTLRVVRRRYFDWLSLSPDPVISVERLRLLLERHHESDLFVTPILNRVRQGHSPAVLIAVIARCRTLAAGRDPAPWSWVRKQFPEEVAGCPPGQALEIQLGDRWLSDSWPLASTRHLRLFEAVAPPPLDRWEEWLRRKEKEQHEPGPDEPASSEPAPPPLLLSIPAPFVPRDTDLIAPLDPFKFLEVDWESTGWASAATDRVTITAVKPGHFRLGLFDHAAATAGASAALLGPRLQELARLVYQGLVRLWVDLQRERVEQLDVNVERWVRQEPLDAALRQSLELLGELLVRPLVGDGARGGREDPASRPGGEPPEGVPRGAASPAEELPAAPSAFLTGLVAARHDRFGGAESALTDRLADLGHARCGAEARGEQEVQPLFQEVALSLADTHEGDGAGEVRSPGLIALRRMLNRIVRQLYSFAFLTEYRDRPTRHPPRLTVYVVGDMGEPFTRAEMRDVLREVHAELLRSFSPIFEFYREGFNHCLAVVPILWMPHPADPFGGAPPASSRSEEAAIIDRVHGIRRWVESVLPPSRRRIAQIFVNGRVTDNAVLSLRDAVRQTRDFISFQARNELGGDDWLRRTAVGAGTSDLFSSFSCYEIDVPTERCREYLANRLARVCLARLRGGWPVADEALPPAETAPPAAGKLLDGARAALEREILRTGEAMAAAVKGRIEVTSETSSRALLAAFDQAYEDGLKGQVVDRWTHLVRRRGRVDDFARDLRRTIAEKLADALTEVRAHGDRTIAERAGRGGLPAVLDGFERLRVRTSEELQRQEELRRAAVELCRRHGRPQLDPLGAARGEVVAAAEQKPELGAMQVGFLLWVLLAFVLGAPLAESIGAWLMTRSGLGTLGTLIGRFDGVAGAALLGTPVAWLLRRHMRRAVARVRAAVDRLSDEVGRLFHGLGLPPEDEERPSMRSLFLTRLTLTAALATRGFALRVLERTLADQRLAFRLGRSIEIQALHLARRAEDLGVRPAAGAEAGADPHDDLRHLFATRDGESVERLIDPRSLDGYFERRVGTHQHEGLAPLVARFVAESGGLADWRRTACLADTDRILAFCRGYFAAIVEAPAAEQVTFAEEVGSRLRAFIARHYPNIGFGAKFIGYEGLDPDGVHVAADSALVLAPPLRALLEQAPHRPRESAIPAALEIIIAGVRPNAAYLLSLVQGIRAHSVRNLRRFESFHDRVHMPDDRTFPLSQEEPHGWPVNHLSGLAPVGDELRGEMRRIESRATGRAGSRA